MLQDELVMLLSPAAVGSCIFLPFSLMAMHPKFQVYQLYENF